VRNVHALATACGTRYGTERGGAIVMDEARDKNMIDDLLALKLKLDTVVKGPFGRSAAFLECIRSTFMHVVNKRHNKPAEMLAKFFDAKLRNG